MNTWFQLLKKKLLGSMWLRGDNFDGYDYFNVLIGQVFKLYYII